MKRHDPFTQLRALPKEELIARLIPLINKAVMINACALNDGVTHPTRKSFDPFDAEIYLWANLRNLHDAWFTQNNHPLSQLTRRRRIRVRADENGTCVTREKCGAF